MTVEELNTKLYEKMFAEQEAFKEKLLRMSPKEVLDHAYEYIAREDLLANQEYNDLSEKQCLVLLKLKDTMEALYQRWLKTDDSRMEEIQSMTEYYADELVREEQLRADRDAR